MTNMPKLGWPDSLPPGTLFSTAGKTFRFVSTANLVFLGEVPNYQGMAVWRDGPGNPTKRVIPAKYVEVQADVE